MDSPSMHQPLQPPVSQPMWKQVQGGPAWLLLASASGPGWLAASLVLLRAVARSADHWLVHLLAQASNAYQRVEQLGIGRGPRGLKPLG
eukprot:scaffold1954_cov268-Pinguiococcus_pyrenoidosus.AAC.39